jgi:hypothetical protein
MKHAKVILLFLVFFLIFYLEPIYIIGIKFAVIWKFFLFLFFIIKYRNIFKLSNKIIKYSYLYTFKNLFNLSAILYPLQSIYNTILSFSFPFFYNIFIKNFNENRLLPIIKKLSIFVIISSIPFHLNLLEPLGRGLEISTFDTTLQNIEYSFIGIFQNAHAAAIITSYALMNIIFFYKKEKKIFYLFLSLLGIINIYMTYVRTGYLMVVLSILFYLIYDLKYIEKIKSLILIGVAFTTFVYFANTDIVINRIFNISKYDPSNVGINYDSESLSSGRTLFWAVNLLEWWNADIITKLFGMGEEVARENMEIRIGLKIFSHNGFIDSFIENGIIGIFLFLGMFFYMIKLVIKNKGSTFFSLAATSTLMFILMTFFQGGHYFLMDLFLGMNLALLQNKNFSNRLLIKL